MPISVSVIIPVYNAAAYVSQAVESALAQPETAEVILVEDGSPDDSLQVCKALADTHEKVHLYQHTGGVNRGAGPSRNLGIQNSACPYIAFLDADDFYLPGRLTVPAQLFEQYPDCDGVYEAVGIHFENEAARARWLSSNMAQVELTTVIRKVEPEDLFKVLMKGGSGHIHLNGLVIRREVLKRSGTMDESIADTLHEDVDFVMRLAAVGRLYPGRIEIPSSVRRVHESNRVSAPRLENNIFRDHQRLRYATYRWCKTQGLKEQRALAFRRMLSDWVQYNHEQGSSLARSVHKAQRLLSWPLSKPSVLGERYYWSETSRSLWAVFKHTFSRGDSH